MDPFEEVQNESVALKSGKRRLSIEEEDRCLICLQPIVDRTILPQCSHDSQCFSCILEWIKHSSKCPLCVGDIGPFIIHKVRSKHDYQRYFISPAVSPKAQFRSLAAGRGGLSSTLDGQSSNHRSQREELLRNQIDAAILRRRHIYAKGLYAKHVATNRHTGYTSHPTPSQISASIELQRRARAFIRRELQVWINLDIEFLINYIISLIKMLDLRSEAGIKLLADLIDPSIPYSEETRKPNTEHLAHELYSFLRSPYKQIEAYDEVVQYGASSSMSQNLEQSHVAISRHRPRHGSISPKHTQSRQDGHNDKRRRLGKNPISSEHRQEENLNMMPRVPKSNAPSSRAQDPELLSQNPANDQFLEYQTPLDKDEPVLPTPLPFHEGPSEQEDSTVEVKNQAALMTRIRSEMTRRRETDSIRITDSEQDLGSSSSIIDPLPIMAPNSVPLTASRRQELLARLQAEKARLDEVQPAEEGDTGADDTASGIQIKGAASRAKEFMEKRLRSQALLRVRLAKEKSRMTELGSIQPSTELPPVPENNQQLLGANDKISAMQQRLREKLLKERLLARRNGLDSSFPGHF